MRQTNLKDRKLNIIEQLIILNDDNVFSQVEEIINSSLGRPSVNKMSKQELLNRARRADDDIEKGNIFSQEDVEKMSKNW
jgi:hypothetical protein